ncbi:uncharacterized protein LACBIDRAFT_302801 [Laccaria bicolor S238N-H82]|uniref:Predicted protein n=1 Tax=Laccaria bicolor (strain S238N-H82 / ATCC MYA-4686) TaxID=486041 RepID=B0DIC2_LACBS|nr:uncharacterized protein LACBIDRAFT_302801 [Laccaria bicolor S238N-H82]EDR05664.1 predicted protein [Laccaria bicolor S238N-H82]|eukprot:XP_001883768.1 predicted protein [Laccaria bicolor S238N-H82]
MQSFHVYSLPPELLHTLTPRTLLNRPPSRAPTPEPVLPPASTSGLRACSICLGITFRDLDEQRTHFRSDWHRYNVKVRLNGGQPVTEAIFGELIDALEDSISGSESSTDEDDGNDSDAVDALVNKTKRLNARPDSPDSISQNTPQTAVTWFHSPPSTQLGIYRALFPLRTKPESYLDELREMQAPQLEGRTWAMFMVAGGHFAGALVQVSQPKDDVEEEGAHGEGDTTGKGRKKKLKKPKPETEVLRHKTFHRYTTRRKQGGSQSTNDNAKGNAKSAGAQLRRYGEQALREDIRNLLNEWAEDIEGCERIWIRASTSNRKIFLNYEDAVIKKGDPRLRTFPFPTRRPTQAELTRCLAELTRTKVSHLTEDALRAQDEAHLASLLPKTRPPPAPSAPIVPEKPKQPKLSKEEELLREKWSRLLEMIHKGRLEPLKAFWDRENAALGGNIDTPVPEWTGERWGTLLQVGTQAGHEDVTQWLLEEARADPTIPVPSKSGQVDVDGEAEDDGGDTSDSPRKLNTASATGRRTAYDLARTKPLRDVFRRCAAAHPEWWDWLGSARVPSALSKEMEEEQEEKKKVRRKGLKERVREREAKDRERETERPKTPPVVVQTKTKEEKKPSSMVANRLGGNAGAADAVMGLTPEMRAKVERERRARAAEARMKLLGATW